jgi:hypothetical protein
MPVALKLARRPDDPRFAREVKLLSVIEHPAVTRFIDRGWWRTEDGRVYPYVVMQWVEGMPLYDWAEMHHATSRQVLQVLARVARALEATHTQGCLHRDVKGDNIRVTPDGQGFLMDFGSGTWAGAPLLTDGLMPPGTRLYRSPEALRFQWDFRNAEDTHYEAKAADDVYALGVAMYRLATGVYPPPGTEPEARREDLRPTVPPRLLPQSLNGRVIPELASLIEWMLADEPERRPSARELARSAEASVRRAGLEADVPLSGLMPVRARPVGSRGCWDFLVLVQQAFWRRPRLGSFVTVVLMVAAWCCFENHRQPFEQPQEEVPAVAEAEAPDAGVGRDGGTADVGDSAMTSQEAFRGAPVSGEAITVEVPDQPLPGQRLAPCLRSGEVEINGGCWTRQADVAPPCDHEEYEWRGACYRAVLKRPRPPTTKKP